MLYRKKTPALAGTSRGRDRSGGSDVDQCSAEGCEKPRHARGLCQSHYDRQFRSKTTLVAPVKCTWCGTEFTPKSARGIFCGSACRRESSRASILLDDAKPHGTKVKYNAGCRCDDCRVANRNYASRYYPEHKEQYLETQRRYINSNRDEVNLRNRRRRAAKRVVNPPKSRTLLPTIDESLLTEDEIRKQRKRLEMREYWAEYSKTPRGKAMIAARNAKRKARKRQADHGCVTNEDVLAIMSLPCVYCGAEAEHLDHIHPLDAGGLHCLDNLAPSCMKCNTSKGAKVLENPPESVLRCTVRGANLPKAA